MNNKEKMISIGIDPSGMGKTGIYIKGMNFSFPIKYFNQLEAKNPVEAKIKILEYIQKIRDTLSSANGDCYVEIKEVVVELLNKGPETFKEVKATRELIGLLREKYMSLFKGHLPIHKDKTEIEKLLAKFGKKSEHWIHAKQILEAHLKEKQLKLPCQKWDWTEVQNGD